MGLNAERVNVVVNNFVSLSCEATGFPPPTLSWLNDRGPIQANTNALIMPGMVSMGSVARIAFQITTISACKHMMHVLRALNVSSWFVLRWSYTSDYESKSFRWRKVQLCGHECSRRGSQTHLPHSIQ